MVKFSGLNFLSVLIIIAASLQVSTPERSFSINYEKNSFYMDGRPFRYVSGSAHYFRMPNEYWRDRLRKMRAAGLNAVSTYVEWSQHEPAMGQYNFTGDLNVKKFIEIAQEEDLYVILRPGPYICAERDFGGFPYWLLTSHPNIRLRSFDPHYIKYVEKWTDVLMNELSPLLYGRGGPIIMVQVENEYGSFYSCDFNYTTWLRDLFKKHVKEDAVLFTTDGANKNLLKCGKIPGVYATVDFNSGSDVAKSFEAQRKFEPKGPLVNSEFYPGWLTHWGEKMARVGTLNIVRTLRTMLDMGANVNFYMFYGGTNFGFTAGANMDVFYVADITSYDYDAPMTEAGDLTEKYYAIKELLLNYLPQSNITVVNVTEKGDYGELQLRRIASIFSPRVKQSLGVGHHNIHPLSFEALNQNFGYLLYETTIPRNSSKGSLQIEKIKDFAHVYVNGKFFGNMSREFQTNTTELGQVNYGDKLGVIVENQGRINFGPHIHDPKGILSDVKLDGRTLESWDMTSFELKDLSIIEQCFEEFENNTISECDNNEGFAFYIQKFQLPHNPSRTSQYELDTFVNVSNLKKGLVFVNGYNLGRYWSTRGPQYTIYLPGVYLKPYPHYNKLIIMEENITAPSIKIKFTKTPIFT